MNEGEEEQKGTVSVSVLLGDLYFVVDLSDPVGVKAYVRDKGLHQNTSGREIIYYKFKFSVEIC